MRIELERTRASRAARIAHERRVRYDGGVVEWGMISDHLEVEDCRLPTQSWHSIVYRPGEKGRKTSPLS